MTQWVQKLSLSCLVVVLLAKTCASSRQFVASIEIDADFTDADYDLQSQRMTDLEEELRRLFGQLEGFEELELESVRPANCNLVARVIVTITSNVSVDDIDNLLETLQCAPVTIEGETYSVYDAVLSSGGTAPCAASGRYCAPQATCEQEGCVCPPGMKGDPHLYCVPEDLEVCVIDGDQQLVTFDGWRSHVPTPCPFLAAMFTWDVNNECNVMVFAGNSHEPIGGRFFLEEVRVMVFKETTNQSVYDTGNEAISNAGQDPLAEVWNHSGPVRPDVLTTYDPVTRTALLILPACNITVAFTAADVSLDQPLAHHSSVFIAGSPDVVSESERFPATLCFAPSEQHSWHYPRYYYAHFATLLHHTSQVTVDPGLCCGEVCAKAAALAIRSHQRADEESLVVCGPILAKPSLASCLPAPIMDTFIACLRYASLGDVDACSQLRTLADGSCPELATNLTMIC